MYQGSELTITNDVEAIAPTIAFLRVVAGLLGLDERETHRICYALEENLSNSILFDFEAGAREEIRIAVNAIASGIELIIRDHGIPRDPFIQRPASVEDIARDTSFDSLARSNGDEIGAVSDFVIHRMLDRYQYANLGRKGRRIEMVLYATAARVGKPDGTEPLSDAGTDGPAVIRLAEHGDLTGIARLFYTCYGYSYVNDVVYYPERLADQIQKRHLTSLGAVADKGRVVGHVALMRPFDGADILEWGMAASAPEYRGQGVMERLFTALLDHVRGLPCSGLFSHSVTNHVFTQKICSRYGFSDVALLLGYAPADLSFKKINQELGQRESTIISFKQLQSARQDSIFPPEHHRELILALYGAAKIAVRPGKQVSTTMPAKSAVVHTVIPVLNIAELLIKTIGQDLDEQLAFITRKLCIAGVDILYLVLDLGSPLAPRAVEQAEAAGYFFAGIFPGYHHPHSLVLQYLNNIAFDYDTIVTLTPTAGRLKSYIRRLDPNQLEKQP
jgi:serine/threonine-protein kinase RsbW